VKPVQKTVLLTAAITAALTGCASRDNAPLQQPLYLYSSASQWQASAKPLNYSSAKGVYSQTVSLNKGSYSFRISDKAESCGSNFSATDAKLIKLNQSAIASDCGGESPFSLKIYKSGDYNITLDTSKQPAVVSVALDTSAAKPDPLNSLKQCSSLQGQPVTVDVSATFNEGEWVTDFYSGQSAQVTNGKLTMQPAEQSGGILLLEPSEKQPDTAFSWDNATVYFVMTDRFHNGDPSNDNSYGRKPDGMDEIGTFHGGDIKGLTEKLDYIKQLGANAIWITAPYEQIHGWTGGGHRGDFPHYAYHGYYVLDYTRMDANMGTEDQFRTFVDAAHEKGIRVVMDVVMNHTGYATLADMQEFNFGKFQQYNQPIEQVLGVENYTDWTPGPGQTWHSFNDYIDYGDEIWASNWWGRGWIRAGIAGYHKPGRNDRLMSLAYLPDFMTESKQAVGLPPLLTNKSDTRAIEIPGYTPRQYLIKWLSDWVREYGVDGFRVDTAKHVELDAWQELKTATSVAFAEWKANHPDKALDSNDFWMTGEVWGHDVTKSSYFSNGFDSVINFDFQKEAYKSLKHDCAAQIEPVFERYASRINSDPEFNVLSYLSSHDTKLFFDRYAKQDVGQQHRIAANFLMAPGGIQIYYGDESARPLGPFGSDPAQGTRSDMNWDELASGDKANLLKHWQTLGQFRDKHNAIAAGEHKMLNQSPYAFSRTLGDDRVVVVIAD